YQAAVLLVFRVIFVHPRVPGPEAYVALYLTLFLATLCGYLIGLAISAAAPNQNAAILLIIGALIPQFLFAGGRLPPNLIPAGEVISIFMPTRWSFEAFIRTTSLGDQLAADVCWARPKPERRKLTSIQKTNCVCLGANIFTRCTDFPGILSPD